MKSITLHNLDSKTVALIEKKSNKTGKSLNKTIKDLLHQALGISPDESKKDEFSEFIGVWNGEDFQEFSRNTKDFDQVDPADWS